jgi:iron(III) transport system permease protein
VIGVGSISFIFGVIPAWLTTFFSFAGSRIFEIALFFPLSIPGYIVAFVYVNTLEFSGPIQSLLREILEWSKGDYWFPEIKSLGCMHVSFSPICATCPAHLILRDLISRIIFGVE